MAQQGSISSFFPVVSTLKSSGVKELQGPAAGSAQVCFKLPNLFSWRINIRCSCTNLTNLFCSWLSPNTQLFLFWPLLVHRWPPALTAQRPFNSSGQALNVGHFVSAAAISPPTASNSRGPFLLRSIMAQRGPRSIRGIAGSARGGLGGSCSVGPCRPSTYPPAGQPSSAWVNLCDPVWRHSAHSHKLQARRGGPRLAAPTAAGRANHRPAATRPASWSTAATSCCGRTTACCTDDPTAAAAAAAGGGGPRGLKDTVPSAIGCPVQAGRERNGCHSLCQPESQVSVSVWLH